MAVMAPVALFLAMLNCHVCAHRLQRKRWTSRRREDFSAASGGEVQPGCSIEDVKDAAHPPETCRRVLFGEGCEGYSTSWSQCNEECYAVKTFFMIEDEECEHYPWAYKNTSTTFKICHGTRCPLEIGENKGSPMMRETRNDMFAAGLNSDVLQNLSKLLEHSELWIMLTLFCAVVLLSLTHTMFREIPDMCVTITVAASLAMVVRYGAFGGVTFGPAGQVMMGEVLARWLNDIILPLHFFEIAYTVHRKNWFNQFGFGVAFAVLGTAISGVLIACQLQLASQWNWTTVQSDWRQSVAYGFMLAPVDHVAVAGIFSRLEVDVRLQTLISIESALNHPVSLIVFNACNHKELTVKFFEEEHHAIKEACLEFFGSIIFGSLLGVVMAALIKPFQIKGKAVLEPLYVLVCSFLSYCLGDFLSFSGIITVLFTGLTMGIYAPTHLQDAHSVEHLFHFLGDVADMLMCGIMGYSVILVSSKEALVLGCLAVGFCFVARAIVLLLLIPAINLTKKWRGYATIPFGVSFSMLFCQARGGVTIMLALQLDRYWAQDSNLLADSAIVCTTLMAFICGMGCAPMLRLCQVPMGLGTEDGEIDETSWASAMLMRMDALVRSLCGFKDLAPAHGASHGQAHSHTPQIAETGNLAIDSNSKPSRP